MKNDAIENNLWPNVLSENGSQSRPILITTLWTGFLFWMVVLGTLLWLGLGPAQAQNSSSDPLVMKIYPDGTKVVLRWSEIGKGVDNGEKFGGAPRIVAYDPAKDGVVPISTTQASDAKTAPTAKAVPDSNLVVTPEAPAKMDYTDANPDDFKEYQPEEGFVFRSATGVAFQQPLSGRNGDGSAYSKTVFQPGIRFDLEPAYNVTDWFRIGLETSFVYNQIHSLQVNDVIYYGPNGPSFGNGGLTQVPIMANIRFQFPSESAFRGYVGASCGASWNVLQASNLFGTYTSYSWNYAYGLTTGFSYTIAQGLDLDFAYKLLATPNPNFADSGSYKTSYNHAAEIGLAWRF